MQTLKAGQLGCMVSRAHPAAMLCPTLQGEFRAKPGSAITLAFITAATATGMTKLSSLPEPSTTGTSKPAR